jgi:hypothetical protein
MHNVVISRGHTIIFRSLKLRQNVVFLNVTTKNRFPGGLDGDGEKTPRHIQYRRPGTPAP